MDPLQQQTNQVVTPMSSASTELRSWKGQVVLAQLLIMLLKLRLQSAGLSMSQPQISQAVTYVLQNRALKEAVRQMERELYSSQTPNLRLSGLQESISAKNGTSSHSSSSSENSTES